MKKLVSILLFLYLTGCENAVVFNSKGAIGIAEKHLVLTATYLMLIVVVPVIFMTIYFAYKYRASSNAKYDPSFYHSKSVEIVVWAIPITIILILGTITWKTTHELDPYKQLDIGGKPILIQVIALDWKWLFIYPDENIATINFLTLPVNRQIEFKLTADGPMNAFQIPQLGGQIYAMAGMQTQLHLIANEVGNYTGRAVNINGRGFSGMHFNTQVVSEVEYNKWLDFAKHQNHNFLSSNEYYRIAKPSENEPTFIYSSVQTNLFNNLMMKFMMPNMDDLSISM